jgi:hypothetical protein
MLRLRQPPDSVIQPSALLIFMYLAVYKMEELHARRIVRGWLPSCQLIMARCTESKIGGDSIAFQKTSFMN